MQDASFMKISKYFYLALGWLCVALGIVGIILPFLPTTPFLLVAVWAFSRSSPELAEKLRNHKLVGPYIRDWQDHGAIPVRAKLLAIVMMLLAAVYLLAFAAIPLIAALVACGVFVGVAVFIGSRPSQPPQP